MSLRLVSGTFLTVSNCLSCSTCLNISLILVKNNPHGLVSTRLTSSAASEEGGGGTGDEDSVGAQLLKG